MIVVPVPILGGPSVPNSSLPEPTFDAQYEAFNDWERNTAAPGMNALANATYQNALESKARAESATASEVSALASKNAAAVSAAAASGSAATVSTKAGEAAASAAAADGSAAAAAAFAGTSNTKAGEASVSAAAATAARDAAQTYRDQAEAFATEQLVASSATNLTAGAGNKVFAIEPGRSFVVGMYLVATSVGAPTASMTGYVVSYFGATGALTLSVDKFTGAGVGARGDWVIGIAAAGAVDAGAAISAAPVKAAPVDDDKLGLSDSAASGGLKGLTFGSLKAAIRTWLLGLANTWGAAQTFGAITATSLNGGQFAGLRNRVINGDFAVWQRGTAFAGAVTQYTADRWQAPGATGQAVSRVADHPTLGADGFCIQVANTAGTQWITHRIEAANCRALVGRTVTISAWVKVVALGAAGVQIQPQYANAVDNFSATTNLTWSGVSASADWTLLTTTFVVPAGGANGIQIRITTSGGGGGAATVRISQVQLEPGPVATPFEARPYGFELALCQRYYYRWTPTAVAQVAGTGYASLATSAQICVQFPVSMRALVSSVEHSGTAADYAVLYQNNVAICNAAPGISSGGFNSARLAFNVAAGVLTVGQGAMLYAQNANAFLGFSAEL